MTSNQPSIRTKRIGPHAYFHVEQLPLASEDWQHLVERAQHLAQLAEGRYNVLKLDSVTQSVTFLNYPGYFDTAFPRLLEYWTVSIERESVQYRTFANSLNPPVLHRKELLLSETHFRTREYERLTASAEDIGLFDNPHLIGFSRAWDDLLKTRGYEVVGHALLPVGNTVDAHLGPSAAEEVSGTIARHKTAMVRYSFSAPVQALARLGFLDRSKTLFDYGCGRGDDLKGLIDNGIEAHGWDPHFSPDAPLVKSDIVNVAS